jgi:hypothetical protein
MPRKSTSGPASARSVGFRPGARDDESSRARGKQLARAIERPDDLVHAFLGREASDVQEDHAVIDAVCLSQRNTSRAEPRDGQRRHDRDAVHLRRIRIGAVQDARRATVVAISH